MTPWEMIQAGVSAVGTIGASASTAIYTRFRTAEKRAKLALQRSAEALEVAREAKLAVAAAIAKLEPDVRAIVDRYLAEARWRMTANPPEQELRALITTEMRALVDRRMDERDRGRSMSPSQNYAIRPDRAQTSQLIQEIFKETIKPALKLEWRSFLDEAKDEIDADRRKAARNSQADDQNPQARERLDRLERRLDDLEREFRRDIQSRGDQWKDFHVLAGEMRILIRTHLERSR